MRLIVGPDGDRRDLVSAAQQGQLQAIGAAVREVVKRSLTTHPMRHPTQAEIKRRADICLGWYEKLRGDLGWPIDRVLSSLGRALAAELDGRTYDPATDTAMYGVDESLEPVAAVLRASPEMLGVDDARRALN